VSNVLPSELIDLANNICKQKAETQTVEVKAAQGGCPKRLYDTLSSFSNQDTGGVILFGLDEKAGFCPVGVYDPQDLQKQVTEQCNQMEPPVRAVFTLAQMENRTICAAEIPAVDLSQRPCYYKGAGRVKGAYIRVGDADLPMTDYELYRYEAFRRHLHDDERTIDRADLSLLDPTALERYVQEKQDQRPGFSRLTREQTYEMLNITRNGIPTVASIMNFCIYPQGYFPQLCITAVVVPGTQIGECAQDNARFLDNRRIEGTISSMVQEAIAFCKRNMRVRTIIDPETGQRQDRTEYPIEAIREAILNALIHRDYSIFTEGTPVQLDFFTNRLEIHSPGGLYGRMTVEQLGITRPDLRNPALATMAEVLTGAENRYSGIPTIRRELASYGLPEPVFENRRNEFVVTFYNGTDASLVQNAPQSMPKQNQLLEFCKTPRTRQEITDYLGLKTTFYAMQHYVQPLVNEGCLKMTIPDKPKSRHQKYYAV
jgi:ATP-dependent DNA helicase RecG